MASWASRSYSRAYGRYYARNRGSGSYYTPSRSYRTRSSRRKANAEASAARQQRDACTVTISRIASEQVVISQGANNGVIAINHWNSLRLSTYFSNYAPMYDQMKIDKIRMKLTGNANGSAVTALLSPAVVLAFDRNGLSPGQQATTQAISTYSSAQLKQWSVGNAFSMYQTIYPSTIMEKGQYIPTDTLRDPTQDTSADNPCVNLASSTLPFKPISLLGVDWGSEAPSQQTFAFTVEYEYTVTFRGMRKPSLGSGQGGGTSPGDLRPLSVTLESNGLYNYRPEDFDGYNTVSAVVDVPSVFPSPDVTLLTHIYEDQGTLPSAALEIPADGWLHRESTAGTTSFASPQNTILLVDFDLGNGVHDIVIRFNKTSTATSWEIPTSLRNRDSYYQRISGAEVDAIDVTPFLGTADGAFLGTFYLDNTTNTQTTATYVVKNMALYPGYVTIDE